MRTLFDFMVTVPAMSSLFFNGACLLTVFVFVAGCGMSEEEARQRLADLNVEYSQDNFVEHAAEGDGTVVDLFLKAGMNPAASRSQEALVSAVEGGHAEVARRLMEAGATLDAGSEQAAEVLVEAAKSGDAETVRMLLEAGGDPNAQADARFPVESVLPPSVIEAVGRERLERRFGDEGIVIEGATPLIGAVAGGNPATVQALLNAGADPSAQPEDENRGGPPLGLAVANGRAEITRALLEAGADPNLKPPNAEGSVLTTAALLGHAEIIRVLLEAGADPNDQENDDELSPLMLAAGALSNRGNSLEMSPTARQETARALLEAGADPNLEDEDGKTALAHATENDYDEVVQILREAGAREPTQSSHRNAPSTDTVAGADTAMVSDAATASRNPNQPLSGTVRVAGSSTVFPLTKAAAEGFMSNHPRVRVVVSKSNTGGGFDKLLRGETAIANAARSIDAREQSRAEQQERSFIELPVARSGIAVVANPRNDWAECLTTGELRAIWEPGSGVNSWSDVRSSFPDRPLTLYGKGTRSSTFAHFTEAILGERGESRMDFNASTDANVLVQGVQGDLGALGFFWQAYYENNAQGLKLLGVDAGDGCVKPRADAIRGRAYRPLSHPLFIYVSRSASRDPAVEAFVDYYLENASSIAREVGYVPLSDRSYRTARQRFEARTTGSTL